MLNLRKKLLVSIFTLMLALVAVSTTTYAWFTQGAVATVSNMELSVKGTESLKVTVVSINKVNTEDTYTPAFSHSLTGALSGILLKPMTIPASYLTGTDHTVDSFYYWANGTYSPAAPLDGSSTIKGEYLEIEFEFLAESSSVSDTEKLYIEFESITLTPATSFSWNSDAQFKLNDSKTVAVDEAINYVRLANALRFSFSSSKNTSTTEGVDAYDAWTNYTVLDPSGYKPEQNDASCANQGEWGGASVNYYNAVNNLTDLEAYSAPASTYTYKSIQNLSLVELVQSNVNTGYVGRVKVRVWLEGWDSDCFNAIIKDSVNIEMSFKQVLK